MKTDSEIEAARAAMSEAMQIVNGTPPWDPEWPKLNQRLHAAQEAFREAAGRIPAPCNAELEQQMEEDNAEPLNRFQAMTDAELREALNDRVLNSINEEECQLLAEASERLAIKERAVAWLRGEDVPGETE